MKPETWNVCTKAGLTGEFTHSRGVIVDRNAAIGGAEQPQPQDLPSQHLWVGAPVGASVCT